MVACGMLRQARELPSDHVVQNEPDVVAAVIVEGPAKNYRPPHPMGVKGGCSPQNNRENFEATKRASSR
jgi:hypothetical protein